VGVTDIPTKDENGDWRVGEMVFQTNAQAWRYIDKANNEPVSRVQDVSDWVATKIANGQ
jgi:hypothetical protein